MRLRQKTSRNEPFSFQDMIDEIPEYVVGPLSACSRVNLSCRCSKDRADWMTARYFFQPFMIMITYSPLFVLSKTRLYSSPLTNFAFALEVCFRDIGIFLDVVLHLDADI